MKKLFYFIVFSLLITACSSENQIEDSLDISPASQYTVDRDAESLLTDFDKDWGTWNASFINQGRADEGKLRFYFGGSYIQKEARNMHVGEYVQFQYYAGNKNNKKWYNYHPDTLLYTKPYLIYVPDFHPNWEKSIEFILDPNALPIGYTTYRTRLLSRPKDSTIELQATKWTSPYGFDNYYQTNPKPGAGGEESSDPKKTATITLTISITGYFDCADSRSRRYEITAGKEGEGVDRLSYPGSYQMYYTSTIKIPKMTERVIEIPIVAKEYEDPMSSRPCCTERYTAKVKVVATGETEQYKSIRINRDFRFDHRSK